MLDVNETALFLALRGEMGKVYASVPDPQDATERISFRFHQENKPRFRAYFEGERPVVHITLQVEGEILTTPGSTDYSKPENRRALEDFLSKQRWPQMYRELTRKVYNEWGADPVGLGNLFRSRFPTIQDWLAYRWTDHVQDVQVKVETRLLIRRFGLLLGSDIGEQEE